MASAWGEPVSTYSRADAIEDGFLVDVTSLATECGFTWPTALTRAAWDRCVEVPEGAEGWQDETGRLWDVLWMARNAIERTPGRTDRCTFSVIVVTSKGGQRRRVKLTLHAGPGDPDGAPVITIMLDGES